MPRLEPGNGANPRQDLRLRTFIGIRRRNPQQAGRADQPDHPLPGRGCRGGQRHRAALNYRTITAGDHPPRRGEPLRPARRMTQEILDLVMENPRALRRGGSGQAARAALRRVGLDHPRRPPLRRPTSEPREDARKRCPPAANSYHRRTWPCAFTLPRPSSRTPPTAANLTEQQRLELKPPPSAPWSIIADPGRAEHRPDEPRRFLPQLPVKWYKAAADIGVESAMTRPAEDLRHALCRGGKPSTRKKRARSNRPPSPETRATPGPTGPLPPCPPDTMRPLFR